MLEYTHYRTHPSTVCGNRKVSLKPLCHGTNRPYRLEFEEQLPRKLLRTIVRMGKTIPYRRLMLANST
jgi:hypothetical protein